LTNKIDDCVEFIMRGTSQSDRQACGAWFHNN